MKLTGLMISLVLAGAVATPVLAAMQTDNTQNLLQAARLWDGKDRPDIARDFLQKILLIKPDTPEALAMLGDIELRSGKPEEALRYQRLLEKINPSSPLLAEMRDLYRLATKDKETLGRMRLLARAGHTAEAEKLLLQLYPNKPPHGEPALEYYSIIGSSPKGAAKAREGLAALYQETGDIRYRLALLDLMSNNSDSRMAAIKGYEEISKISSVNARRLQESWRRSLYKLHDNPNTIVMIRRYLTVFPDDKSMMDQIGTVQKNTLEQMRVAGSSIGRDNGVGGRTAIEEDRNSRDPNIVARAAALDALDKGDLELAEKKLQYLLKLRPADPEIIGGLGLIRLRRGEHTEAESWFAMANLATRGSSKKWKGLVTTAQFWRNMRAADNLLEEHKLAEAEEVAKTALALQPNDPDALALLGNIRLAAKDNEAAEKLFREALARDGDNGSAIRGLVSLLARTARRDDAFALLADYAKRYPKDQSKYAGVQANLLRDEADTYVAAGRPSHAMQALEMAVVLSPADPWHRFALAKLYNSLGLAPLARQVMYEGIVQAPNDPSMRYASALILISQNEYETALQDLAVISSSEKTQSMRDAEVRASLNLHIDQANAQLALGKPQDAARIMVAAEKLAAEQQDLSATEQVVEGWFGLNLPERGLELMRRDLKPASPVADQLYYASLLNRAKKDQELTEFLPRLSKVILAEPADLLASHEVKLREINSVLFDRELERLVEAGGLTQARKLVEAKAAADALDDASVRTLARQWRIVKKTDKALPLLQGLKNRNPADVETRIDIANTYYDARQNGLARQEAADLLAMTKGDDLDGRLDIVRLLIHIDDYATARKMINDLLQTHAENPDVLLQAGRVAKAEHNYSQAMRYFKMTGTLADQVSDQSRRATNKEAGSDILLNLLPADEENRQSAVGSSGENIQLKLSMTLAINDATAEVPSLPVSANKVLDRAKQEMEGIEARRQPRLEVAMDSLFKASSDGTSSYKGKEIPVVAWIPIGYDGHGFVHVDSVDIDAGNLPANFSDSSLFGQIQAAQYKLSQALPQKVSGTSVGVGYESDGLRTDIGIIGIGFPVSNLVGGLQQSGTVGRLDYSLELSRRPQTSSLLSYAGTTDPVSGKVWGGVTNTGFAGKLTTTLNDYSLLANLSYGALRGKNVLNNDRLGLQFAIDRDVYHSRDMVINAGAAFNYSRFAANESFYTFGHGGYYSPQRSLGITLPLEVNGRFNRLSYLVKASVSYSQTQEKNMAVYPNDPALQTLANTGPLFPAFYNQAIYTGGIGGGVGYAFRAVGEYRITPNVSLGGRVDIDRSAFYAPSSGFIYLRYNFKPELGEIRLSPNAVKPYSQF